MLSSATNRMSQRHNISYITATVYLLTGLLAVTSVSAQPPKVDEKLTEKSKEKPSDWERLIYLPYKNLGGILEQEKSTVFMPYSQFLKLWRSAKPETESSEDEVQAVISQANYLGTIENNLARIEATFKIQVLGKPWVRIPLKFGDAAIGKLTAANEQILLKGTGEGTYELLLPTAGEHTVKLELLTRVHTSTEGKSFELEIPLVGISQLELKVPSPDQTVDVVPHLVATPLESDANSTRIVANVGSTNRITARWFPRISKTPEMELLTSVTNLLHVRVADGLVQTEAVLNYQILRGELNQVAVAIPLGHRILDVTAPNLKGWKAANEANRQLITVELLGGTGKSVPVEVRTEHPVAGDVLELGGIEDDGQVHGIHAVGAVRESGTIVAGHGVELSLAIEQQRGLIRIEANEVPEELRKPESLYFKFYNPAFRLATSVKPVEPRVTLEHSSILEFHEDELRLLASMKYTVERAGLFELKYQVPDGVVIDSVDCEQKQEFAVSPDGKSMTLTLTQKTQGTIHVNIRGHLSFESAQSQQKLTLPILEPLDIAREQGKLQVFAPEAIEVITDEKSLISAQPDRTLNQQERMNLRMASAWTFNRRPVEIPVTTVRKPTRLTAKVSTRLEVNREIAEVITKVVYQVQYAGLDTFRIQVPAAVADNVQINPLLSEGAVPVKQKSQAEAKDGWVTWTIVTQREVVGPQTFEVKYDQKLNKQSQTAKIVVQPVRVLGVAGDNDQTERVPITNLLGEIVVRKDRLWSLAATPKELQTIDVRELTLLPVDGALAYRYSRQTGELTIEATEHEIQEVVQTVISRALIEAVLTQDDMATYRCRFQLKTSERQRLLLELPAKVQPLGVMVAGKQVSLERSTNPGGAPGSEMYYINVARSGRSDEPFSLTLVYRIPDKGLPSTGFGGPLEMHIPQLGATSNGQSVAVQQLRVALWVPEMYSVVGTPRNFTPGTQLGFKEALTGKTTATRSTGDLENWIGETGSGLFEFPTAGHAFVYENLGGVGVIRVYWWRTSWVTWIWSLSLFAVAYVLRRTSLENKLGVLLVGAFVAALYALSDSDLTMFVVSSARFGIGLMLMLWVIDLFTRKGSTKPIADSNRIVNFPAHAAVIPPPGIFDDVRERLQH